MNYAEACAAYEEMRRASDHLVFLVEKRRGDFYAVPESRFAASGTPRRAGADFYEYTFGKTLPSHHAMMPIRRLPRSQFIAELKARREVLGQ